MTIPPIPNKYRSQHITQIDIHNHQELFAFFVRQFYFTQRWNEAFTFLQFSQLVFKEKNSDLMRQILSAYQLYFVGGIKKKLLMEKVFEEHPYIWDEKTLQPKTFSITKLILALEDEIKQIQRANRQLFLPIKNITQIAERNNLLLYSAIVFTKSEEFVALDEGAMVSITASTGTKYRVTVLDYNKKTETVIFQTTQNLDFTEGKIKVSNVAVLYKLMNALENIKLEGDPINKLVYEQVPQAVTWEGIPYLNGLSAIQKHCIEKALTHNVNFIWGPPGTGKSFTLCRLLVSLYLAGEKTLVSSTANVAIDGLLEKTASVLDDIYFKERKDLAAEKRMLRIGYSQSDKIRANELFQITNEAIADLNFKLQKVNEQLEDLEESPDAIKLGKLKSHRDELKQKLDTENKKMLTSALLIFTTSAKVVSDEALKSFEYDNLVIDEGSMMSLPYLLVLAAKVKKRIIITGDFMQLGPIASSQSLRAERWLKADLFDLLGDNHDKIIGHSALFMLTEQRRMAKPIADLINKPFYKGRLTTVNNISQMSAVDLGPAQGHVIFIETPNIPENKAEVDPISKSKYNKYSRNEIHKLIYQILSTNSRSIKTIGVIAPYKQQIIDYKNESEVYQNQRIEVIFGTIHTFQGSECDIVIWDMVDTLQSRIGSLYRDRTGERLVNVAISRAKSKLIVVGQSRLFHECDGRQLVSSNLRNIVSSIKSLRS